MHINGDIDTAELFAELYKDKLRYIPEAKSFYFYNGIVWQQDIEEETDEAYVLRCTVEEDGSESYETIDDEEEFNMVSEAYELLAEELDEE